MGGSFATIATSKSRKLAEGRKKKIFDEARLDTAILFLLSFRFGIFVMVPETNINMKKRREMSGPRTRRH